MAAFIRVEDFDDRLADIGEGEGAGDFSAAFEGCDLGLPWLLLPRPPDVWGDFPGLPWLPLPRPRDGWGDFPGGRPRLGFSEVERPLALGGRLGERDLAIAVS